MLQGTTWLHVAAGAGHDAPVMGAQSNSLQPAPPAAPPAETEKAKGCFSHAHKAGKKRRLTVRHTDRECVHRLEDPPGHYFLGGDQNRGPDIKKFLDYMLQGKNRWLPY